MIDRLTAEEVKGRKARSVAHLKIQGGFGWMYEVEGLPRLQFIDQTVKGKTTRTWLVDHLPHDTLDRAIAAYNGEPMPEPEKKKYSINAQISEVEREIAMREKVYPRLKYGTGQTFSRRAEADMALEVMQSVKETLEWLKENRPAIIEWIKARTVKPSAA